MISSFFEDIFNRYFFLFKEETILLIAECECEVKYFFIDDFNSNYFDTFRNLAVQFVIESKYLRELEEKGFDKNNIVIEKKNHKLKEFIKLPKTF